MSLRVALEMLGLGPCHHMEVVIDDKEHHTPLWVDALAGRPDWSAIYAGFASAVDWPTASFYRELAQVFPEAKFVLTHRDPKSWVESFSETIYLGVAGRAEAPAVVRAWLDMCADVIARAGIGEGLSSGELEAAFNAHNAAVREAIPAGRLLEFQVREGWDPLCAFLGVPVPGEPFPRRNDRAEFWQLMEDGGV
jgi:hypothetical protein